VEALPRTIQDAIIAVRGLGETYLWTDIVCIDQQDQEDFNAQIEQMDLIYEAALCTIVALNGRDADSGLPGVRTDTRKEIGYKLDIEGTKLVAGPHVPFPQTLQRGYWKSRAWTFQEELLSRRCLFFGDHEVLYRCRESIGRESIDSLNFGKSHHLTDTDYSSDNSFEIVWNFKSFQERVQEYLSR
jgi:Heterokaryon incompatibility protein (HET)